MIGLCSKGFRGGGILQHNRLANAGYVWKDCVRIGFRDQHESRAAMMYAAGGLAESA
jgi:hypothetical protein